MIHKILCFFGFHNWMIDGFHYIGPIGYKDRYCKYCNKVQYCAWGRWCSY